MYGRFVAETESLTQLVGVHVVVDRMSPVAGTRRSGSRNQVLAFAYPLRTSPAYRLQDQHVYQPALWRHLDFHPVELLGRGSAVLQGIRPACALDSDLSRDVRPDPGQ